MNAFSRIARSSTVSIRTILFTDDLNNRLLGCVVIALTGQCTLKGDNQYSTKLCLDRDGRKKKSAWLHMSVNTSIHYRHALDALAFRPERGNEIAGSVCG